jgi:flagellar assembly protein FliH
LHVILEKTLEKRQEILDETEQQIVELVLLIARKVVKVISETQRNVVMQNILQSLRRVKGRGDVTIRVNLADVQLTSEHAKEFMDSVESIKNITVAEDSSVEKGGCIIETDFGAIDARISSQLNELEQKILEISPIKTVTKTLVD